MSVFRGCSSVCNTMCTLEGQPLKLQCRVLIEVFGRKVDFGMNFFIWLNDEALILVHKF